MSESGDRPRDARGRFAPLGSGEAARALQNPYSARLAFLPIHARDRRWAVVVAHRRAGKTVACINELIAQAARCPLKDGRYAYIAPQLNQAKDIAWQYLLDYTEFMGPERKTSASELWVELPNNGARIRLYGADNAERMRGIYLDGAVLDEFGDWEPGVWTRVVRPLLTDREGFAIITGTPKGRNGFWRVWQEADGKEGWLQLTLPASRTGLLRPGELEDVRQTLSEEEYAQEYECSFEAAVRGAYWGKEMAAIEAAGRIGDVPMNAGLTVHTAWDLGMADSTVIWLIQHDRVAGEYYVIDMIKGEGEGLDWYAKTLEASRERHDWPCPWVWGDHILPHDAAVRELGTGKSRLETLEELGIRGRIAPNLSVADGIQAVRRLLPSCRFDRTRCGKGIEALRLYRRDFEPKGEEYKLKPVHDWTSHYADAFRMFAVGFQASHPDAGRRYRRDTRWVV